MTTDTAARPRADLHETLFGEEACDLLARRRLAYYGFKTPEEPRDDHA